MTFLLNPPPPPYVTFGDTLATPPPPLSVTYYLNSPLHQKEPTPISKMQKCSKFPSKTILWTWLTVMLANSSVIFENLCFIFISKRIKISKMQKCSDSSFKEPFFWTWLTVMLVNVIFKHFGFTVEAA